MLFVYKIPFLLWQLLIAPGLEDELSGLLHGHEVAGDLRIGDHAALFDLAR